MGRALRLSDGRVNLNFSDVAELSRRLGWLERKLELAEDRMTMHSVRHEASALERAVALMTDELGKRNGLPRLAREREGEGDNEG
jgi:hypothetical protein